ncbi:unnamed protein product [Rotaria magnacalcarata]|uniref:Uncharacterized protein n=2 Tax=Rotaria magnacalcarata TaxID=392030 RepID=A0A815BRB6_9BILA|nr:unnamed protein product [Rotaria magnacalcarata]CAF1275267.1 unnamed protein product [Rotaria magnacalcarata]CAF4667890.1 unnamed protein product [Rotaria magnacalcarata]
MHDRFWSEILLKIHHKLKWLDLEPTSLECILVAANCSNLYEVSLILNKAELYSIMHAHRYHELILPLLHRMLNLEQLDLQLQVHRTKGFIDGHDLKENIINYMSQ